MYFRLNSSRSFREKLAEREEAIPIYRILIHNNFLKTSNIRTIEIRSRRLLRVGITFGQSDQFAHKSRDSREWLPVQVLSGPGMPA